MSKDSAWHFRFRATLFALLALAGCGTSLAVAAIIYVDDDADPGGDGSSWAMAFKYLQDALCVSLPGDEIRVGQGIYNPDRDADHPGGTGDRLATFWAISDLELYGGYAGLTHPSNPDAHNIQLYETRLSGDLAGDDGPDFENNDENSYTVVVAESGLLDGFTITAGNNEGWAWGMFPGGGGVRCIEGSPTITNCRITGNMASGEFCYGGGVYLEISDATISNCTIAGNVVSGTTYAVYGGGVGLLGCGATITNCTIMGNTASGYGGGAYGFYDYSVFTNCTIAGNTAGEGGGGFCNEDGDFVLVNCTIAGNIAGGGGGGIDCWTEDCWACVANCLVWGNSPYEIYYCSDGGGLTVSYSDVQGGQDGVGGYHDGNLIWGPGNIDADPLFVDPDGPDDDLDTWQDNDYRLSWDSPCIDAGRNGFVPAGVTTDLDRNPRIVDGDGDGDPVVDMGAYELQAPDQLHIVGPVPNQIPVGGTGTIDAVIEISFVPVPDRELVFSKLVGSFTFTAGTVSPDGMQAAVTTNANGAAQMTFVADAAGNGLIGVTVTNSALPMAFSVFEIVPPAPGPRELGDRRSLEGGFQAEWEVEPTPDDPTP